MILYFFFLKQKTAYEMRISDWSSDVCSSDLHEAEDANVLADRWETLPKPLKSEPRVVIAYADRAAELRWEAASARSIEQALDARWDERPAARYGTLPIARRQPRPGRNSGG